MKIYNSLLLILLCLLASGSIHATQFVVMNKETGSRKIFCEPIWTGRARGWVPMGSIEQFNTGLHHLKILRWKLPSGECWFDNVEDVLGTFAARFNQKVVIRLYVNGVYTIDLTGNISLLSTVGEGMPRQATKCKS